MRKEESKYKKRLRQTADGPPPSPPNFSEEHELLCETMPGEMKRRQKVTDTSFVKGQNVTDTSIGNGQNVLDASVVNTGEYDTK